MIEKEEFNDLLEHWTNTEKAQAIALLKSSMAQSVPKRTETHVVSTYVKDTIKKGIQDGNIPDYPEDFSTTAKSLFYKEAIQTVVKEIKNELHIDESNDSLKLAWTNCEKSKSLVDFRRAFKMYITVLKSETYTIDEIQEYVDLIDEQDKEIRKLLDYKRIHDEMFGVLSENDEELNIVLRANKMKESNFTDKDICKVLGITRDKLNYARKRVSLSQQNTQNISQDETKQ